MIKIHEYTTYREAEILPLYAAVGWTAYTDAPEALREGFARSLLVLAAWEEGRLLGLARAVGDGSTILYLQDLLVAPAWQHRGIGSRLLRSVLERYPAVRQVLLAADDTPALRAFYQAQGFRELAGLGCCAFMKV